MHIILYGTDDHTLPDLLFFRPTRGMGVKDFAPSRHHYAEALDHDYYIWVKNGNLRKLKRGIYHKKL